MIVNIPKDNRNLEKELEEIKIKLEKALSEKKHLFERVNYIEKIINLIPGHVYWKNRTGVYQGCNENMAKRLKLISNSEIIGKTVFELIPEHKELARKTSQEDERIMVVNQRKDFEEEGLDAQGNLAMFMTSKVLLRDLEGKVKGLIGISFDITKQKQAHIAKQEFLKNMAHDIRTPLSGVIGLAQIQQMGLESLEESKEYGQMIYETGNQLLELLNTVIKTIDTEHMTDPVKMEPLDLSGLARELHALMEPSVYTKGLKFILDIDKALPIILSDRIKLKRVLLNILSNAVKFTKAGEINFIITLLVIENNSAKVEIRITDTGIGIAKENLGKIFDRFYRAHPSYLAEYSGYGISLYLAKETLDLLGGDINVESEEGKGSCFTLHFTFPLANKNLSKIETVLESSKKIQARTGSVLVAEDNAIVLRVVKNQLEKAGYEVIATMDGKAALEALKMNSVVWALLDIGLPELRGTEACKQYRKWEKENGRPYLPVFALTGHSVSEVEKECNEAGIDKIFVKPLNDKIIQEIELFVNK